MDKRKKNNYKCWKDRKRIVMMFFEITAFGSNVNEWSRRACSKIVSVLFKYNLTYYKIMFGIKETTSICKIKIHIQKNPRSAIYATATDWFPLQQTSL